MSTTTRFLGARVGEAEVARIREFVSLYPGLSRMELAATVCEQFGWTRGNGNPKARECREFLERLEEADRLTLPAKRGGRPVGSRTSVPLTSAGEARAVVTGTVRDVAPVEFKRVVDHSGRLLFRELVGRYHYLGHAVPYGAHVRYLVFASRPSRDVLGCVQFSSPAWRMSARDRWIGWDDETRRRNLVRVVSNSRFLILPWVQVRNLASTVLSQASRVLARDWRELYGVEPLLVETLVDEGRFRGTCYRAANWVELGSTSGRGRMDREHEREGAAPKRLFVYPLRRDAQRQLAAR